MKNGWHDLAPGLALVSLSLTGCSARATDYIFPGDCADQGNNNDCCGALTLQAGAFRDDGFTAVDSATGDCISMNTRIAGDDYLSDTLITFGKCIEGVWSKSQVQSGGDVIGKRDYMSLAPDAKTALRARAARNQGRLTWPHAGTRRQAAGYMQSISTYSGPDPTCKSGFARRPAWPARSASACWGR